MTHNKNVIDVDFYWFCLEINLCVEIMQTRLSIRRMITITLTIIISCMTSSTRFGQGKLYFRLLLFNRRISNGPPNKYKHKHKYLYHVSHNLYSTYNNNGRRRK